MRYDDYSEILCPDLNCWQTCLAIWDKSARQPQFRLYATDPMAIFRRFYAATLPCGHAVESDVRFQVRPVY